MNPLTPYNIHTGGTLSNGLIRDPQTNDVPVFNSEDSAWHNLPSTSLDVAVKTSGTGLYTSGVGDTASPLIFSPIQIAADKSASGATLSITSLHGTGSSTTPLYYEWTGMTQAGDMIYWGNDTIGPQVVSTGGSSNEGFVLTVNTSGLPEFIQPNEEAFNAYVFPDSGNANVTVASGTWTALNGTNAAKPFPYKTGGLIAADTLKFTAPKQGTYRLVASITIQSGSTGTFGTSFVAPGFDYNNSGNPSTSGTVIQHVMTQGAGTPSLTLQIYWERAFNTSDTAQFYVIQNTSTSLTANCNWMSAVML